MKKEDGNSEEGMRDCLRDRASMEAGKRASHRQEQDKDMHMMSRNVGKHAGLWTVARVVPKECVVEMKRNNSALAFGMSRELIGLKCDFLAPKG